MSGNGNGNNATATIDSVNGGNYVDFEGLKAELTAKKGEDLAEKEDAVRDAARARDLLRFVEELTSTVTNVALPPDHIARVQALAAPPAAKLAAAEARIAAADASLAQTQACLEMAARHIALMGKAAGKAYGNNGNGAK
jgi:hypothetical protein